MEVNRLKGKNLLKPIGQIKDRIKEIETRIKLSRHRFKKFRPKVSFKIEKGDYYVTTAENPKQMEQCLRLRYRVFMNELLNKKSEEGVDIDKMDLVCDHIMIMHKPTDAVVGTYRVASSIHTDKFYSQGEFNLDELLSRPGNKVELGRACIDKDHRTGSVMQLLWRGVSEYFKATSAQYLFGCTSIKTMDALETAKISKYFQQKGWVVDKYNIEPTKKFVFKEANKLMNQDFEDLDEVKKLIPSLLVGYIRAGSKITLPPALDKDFKCVDFLTILDLDEMSPTHVKKFKGE